LGRSEVDDGEFDGEVGVASVKLQIDEVKEV